ncbi:MAG TPA: type II secretion system protein [Sedimentisphaerales bacterium]|nr:type II secretion system protein [Sedimentisphaerales bacterium]
MRKGNGFTLIELLVVIAVMVLLMAILLPSLQRVKRQAKAVACQSNLHQWALRFASDSVDSDNTWWKRGEQISPEWGWYSVVPGMDNYLGDCNDMLLCPMAAKIDNRLSNIGWYFGSKFSAWGCTEKLPWRVAGSYGINYWLWIEPGPPSKDIPEFRIFWNSIFVKSASVVPGYFDCTWPNGMLFGSTSLPPEYDDTLDSATSATQVCINRHNGYVNYLFMDLSVRRVGLKELWTLKWHKEFDTAGPWTKSGGVQPEDWPQWMRHFKDY